MTEHISRKELKTDEVRDSFMLGAQAVLTHQKSAVFFLGACIVILAAVLGWRLYTERQTVKAAAAYDNAMDAFNARIRTVGEPAADPGETTYVDDKNKFEDAAKKFEAVARKYPHTRPGQISAYYAGLSLVKLNRNDEATKWLEQVARSGDEDFATLAKFEMAQLDDNAGKAADAEKIYQDLMAHPSVFVPKPESMLALADHYRAANKNADAAKIYNQIKAEFPDGPIAQQAGQDLALLPGQS
ncbi:MAG: tetratricopeptide repeat protein [Candidatus Acidiferrales bacterium]